MANNVTFTPGGGSFRFDKSVRNLNKQSNLITTTYRVKKKIYYPIVDFIFEE